jgi:hypothetical protein
MIEAVEAIRLEIEGPLAKLVLDRPRVLNAGNRQWVAVSTRRWRPSPLRRTSAS